MTLSDIQDSLLSPAESSIEITQPAKPKLRTPILTRFIRMTRFDLIVNLLFVSLIAVECLLLVLFFTFLMTSALLAVDVGMIFATGFSFFIWRLHQQAQKPEKMLDICQAFEEEFERNAEYPPETLEYHIALANGYARMAGALHGKEYRYYPLPGRLQFFKSKISKLSAWCHWYDVHKMKELLLHRSVEEYIEMIKTEPTNLEFHAALANAYVMLSGLYHPPAHARDGLFGLSQEMVSLLQDKFKQVSEKAIEEFKILNEYSPNDPWVHQQLAYSYHDLQMPQQEINEYENLLDLLPEDDEILYKLGTLYFKQGENAKGLSIYETLRDRDPSKADALVQHYGAPFDL